MRFYFSILFILITLLSYSQAARKKTFAERTVNSPRINGILDDTVWNKASIIDDFRQFLPDYDQNPSFRTEVRILYDDQAIYIGAYMHDPYPDSIPMQLGNRDDEDMNAEYLSFQIDTYNNQLDAYSFVVSVAGVQSDSRKQDETYNGVWESAVKRTKDGWVAEMRIPYSAIRFPKKPEQVWGMELMRSVRRYREFDQWALVKPEAANSQAYWGELHGIKNIEPPVRLSLTPYLAATIEHSPVDEGKDISTSLGGGLDLKYGLDESFTLDMTLLPDFSQVQSDNKVKNLTAFETVYEEQRPFFNEAVDLFAKGDLFYSRRIGKTPEKFFEAGRLLKEGEKLKKNPVQQRLLNATKLSGRDKSGLAIGILNAVTGNTYAVAEDASGNQRNILTDPATNYNIMVFDQAFRNNSDIYLSNSNVIRGKGYSDANVTAGGLNLMDKSNTYQLNINGGVSQNYHKTDTIENQFNTIVGYKYYAGIAKTNGNFQWSITTGGMNHTYDANALGMTLYNNYRLNSANLVYNVYKPWWIFRDMRNQLTLQNENNFRNGKIQKALLEYQSIVTTMNYTTWWVGMGCQILEVYDYYEPRVAGNYYIAPKSINGTIGVSTDYRKPFAIDAFINAGSAKRDKSKEYGIRVHPIIRVNNHFIFDYNMAYIKGINGIGFADKRSVDSIIFGKRDVLTIENAISGKYLFRNNLSLNLKLRHYWSRGEYNEYFFLLGDGRLSSNKEYTEDKNFNFNSFNIDMVFAWIFAPGSSLNIVWKNSILSEDIITENNFISNLSNTFDSPQTNSLSVKILYYLDYQQMKRRK